MNMSPRLLYYGNVVVHPILLLYIEPINDLQIYSKILYMWYVENFDINLLYEIFDCNLRCDIDSMYSIYL